MYYYKEWIDVWVFLMFYVKMAIFFKNIGVGDVLLVVMFFKVVGG